MLNSKDLQVGDRIEFAEGSPFPGIGKVVQKGVSYPGGFNEDAVLIEFTKYLLGQAPGTVVHDEHLSEK